MPTTRQQAIINALRSTTYPVGMCAKWTREQYGIAALGDYDGDGDADAVDMWKACGLKNHGDRNPPAGVPVFWSGGSKGHGHAAISLGGGMVRSIDRPVSGQVGTVPLEEIERVWRLPYLGWTYDLYGHAIPDPEGDALAKERAKERAILDRALRRKLKEAQRAARKAGRLSMRDRLKKMRLRTKR